MSTKIPTFSSQQVSKAAGMSHDNFRQHLSRKGWRIIGRPQPESGAGHLFSIHDALGYALARVLTFHGVDAKSAFDLAMMDFAHTGDERRDPGGVLDPEKFGRTFYVYSLGAETGQCVGSAELADPVQLLCPPMHSRAEAAIIVDLNRLRDRVFHALGLDARDYE